MNLLHSIANYFNTNGREYPRMATKSPHSRSSSPSFPFALKKVPPHPTRQQGYLDQSGSRLPHSKVFHTKPNQPGLPTLDCGSLLPLSRSQPAVNDSRRPHKNIWQVLLLFCLLPLVLSAKEDRHLRHWAWQPLQDLPATALHLLGLDHEQLTWYHNGLEQRLTGFEGKGVIHELIA